MIHNYLMQLTPAQLGALRALGIVVLESVLIFLGNAANLNGVVNTGTATIVSMLALAVEHAMEAKTGNAGFGSISIRK